MNEIRYMISDTAKMVEVEAHVLRYWEEELDMPISRNEMGHRYYTKEDIQVFQNIKELKGQGFQLKAIKILLPDLKNADVKSLEDIHKLKEELNNKVGGTKMQEKDIEREDTEVVEAVEKEEIHTDIVGDDKMQQFQMILGNVVQQVLEENNKTLGKEVGTHVSDQMIKQVDYLMRMKDEKEEERFKKLDETIRSFQKSRQEAAAAVEEGKPKKKRGLFGRKKKYKEIG